MPLTINGEPVECVGRVEWVPAPVPKKPKIALPTSYKIKMDLDPETRKKLAGDIAEMCKPEWFTVEMDGVIIGRMRDIEELGYDRFGEYHMVTADFEPAEGFKEFFKDEESPMELNAVIFLFDDAGNCRGIHFVREE